VRISTSPSNVGLIAGYYRFQSGFHPPGDIPFEDLSKIDVDSTISHPAPISHPTMRNTISSKNLKKRVGLFGIFGSSKVSPIKVIHFLIHSYVHTKPTLFLHSYGNHVNSCMYFC
jgi:hypothetical protein